MKYLLTLLFIYTSTSYSLDNLKYKNAGNVLICYESPNRKIIKSIELYDYWEQSQINQVPGGLNLGNESLNLKDKVNLVFNRISKFESDLSNKFKINAEGIFNNIDLYLADLDNIPNSENNKIKALTDQQNCFIERFALQNTNPNNSETRFLISKKIYNSLFTSNSTRAGMILHELFLQEQFDFNSINEPKIRYINYLFSTNFIENIDFISFAQLLIDNNLLPISCKIETYGGLKIVNSIKKISSGGNTGGNLDYYGELCLEHRLNFENSLYIFRTKSKTFGSSDLSHLSIENNVHNSNYVQIRQINTPLKIQNTDFLVWFSDSKPFSIEFYNQSEERPYVFIMETNNNTVKCKYYIGINEKSGLPDSCILAENKNIKVKNKNYTLKENRQIKFYTNGELHIGELTKDSINDTFQVYNNNKILVKVRKCETNEEDCNGTREFTLSQSGELLEAFSDKPIHHIINNVKVKFRGISINLKNGLNNSYYWNEVDAKFNKNRLFDSKNSEGNELCRLLGYLNPKTEITGTKLEFVGSESFFDVTSGKIIKIIDDNVNVITSLNCSGWASFKL